MTSTQTALTCSECGRTFGNSQGLGAHRKRAHGIAGTARSTAAKRRALPVLTPRQAARHPAAVSPFVTRTQVVLDDLAEPLRDQLGAIEGRLSELDSEAKELREARTRINAVLARLDPEAVAKPKPAAAAASGSRTLADRRFQEKVDAVRAAIKTDPRFADGFTSNIVAHTLTSEIQHGLSTKTARDVLERLRDEGVVRHDRVVKGGGMQFKLVTSLNGDHADG